MKSSRSALGNHRTWQASFGRWAQMTCWNWLFCSLWEAPEFAYWRSRRCCCGEHSDDGKTRRHPLSPSRLAPTPDRPCKSPKKGRPPGQWRTALKVPCDEPTGGMTHRRVKALSCKKLPLLTRSQTVVTWHEVIVGPSLVGAGWWKVRRDFPKGGRRDGSVFTVPYGEMMPRKR